MNFVDNYSYCLTYCRPLILNFTLRLISRLQCQRVATSTSPFNPSTACHSHTSSPFPCLCHCPALVHALALPFKPRHTRPRPALALPFRPFEPQHASRWATPLLCAQRHAPPRIALDEHVCTQSLGWHHASIERCLNQCMCL
jgi:hypothetical protein